MKDEITSWFGQSIADKIVTGALVLLVSVAASVSTRVPSDLLQQVLLYTAIAGGFSLVLIVYLNRRLARMEARHLRSENLHALAGYVIRHRINESPRSGLERRVQFTDPADRDRAIHATIEAHRAVVRKWVNSDNPELSIKEIDDLLDEFYGERTVPSTVDGV